MGAWGSGSFENDTALDWAASVGSLDDVREPFERLKETIDASGPGERIYLDADLASELVAAAETIAMLMGRRIPGFPEDLAERLADAGVPDDRLYHKARDAICRLLRNSELAELWEETAKETGINEWHVSITGLIDRLNPDIEFEPWTPAEIEQQSGGPVTPCAFCGLVIENDRLFGMNIHDFSDRRTFERGLFFHLACLNARLHHNHAIADLKFDPANLPDLDGD